VDKKGKGKKRKLYKREIALNIFWTMDQVINSSYSRLYFRNIKATN
jgi:hypothetical protein